MNMAQKTLGENKVTAICKKHDLNEGEEKIINEILSEWDNLIGKEDEKIKTVCKKTFYLSFPRKVFYALLEISAEFAMAEIRKQMH